jgi:tRNA modification GTPase
LRERLATRLEARFAAGDAPVLSRLRHRQALQTALAALDRMAAVVAIEEAAEELRVAVAAIGRITGRVDVEDMLDVIFRDFCIGK